MYLESQGTKVSFSPRLAQTEYSNMAVSVWSFAWDFSVAVAWSITPAPSCLISTTIFSGNASSVPDCTFICPLRRYFSPVRRMGYRKRKLWKKILKRTKYDTWKTEECNHG